MTTSDVRLLALYLTMLVCVGSCKATPGPTFTAGPRDGNCYTYAIDETGPARNPALPELRPISGPDDCVSGWPIALALSPTDYHWWRRDAGGWWSHKPGRTDPTQTDYWGNAVRSPQLTYRGPYEHFVGYFCAGSS